MNRTLRLVLLLAVLLPLSHASAEPPEPPFMAQLFPPDLIMRHGREVGLRADQRKAITAAVASTQAKTLELQWDMQEAAQSLGELMRHDRVDAEAALAAAKRVMDLEGQVKRAHLGLLIQIKNQLDPEQQRRLRKLREADGS